MQLATASVAPALRDDELPRGASPPGHHGPESGRRVRRPLTKKNEQLYARLAPVVRRVVVARLRHDDEIEDSIHEVFIQIFRNIDGLRDPACLDFWSERIANNVVNTVIRRRTRMRRLSEAYELATQENFFIHDWIGHSLARRVMAAIARMSPRDAELLYAYWFEPGTYEQMAARSKCSISKMTRRLQRARARFSAVASHDPRLACLMEG